MFKVIDTSKHYTKKMTFDYYESVLGDEGGKEYTNISMFFKVTATAREDLLDDESIEKGIAQIQSAANYDIIHIYAKKGYENVILYGTHFVSEDKETAIEECRLNFSVFKNLFLMKTKGDIEDLSMDDEWVFDYIQNIEGKNVDVFVGQPKRGEDKQPMGTTSYSSSVKRNSSISADIYKIEGNFAVYYITHPLDNEKIYDLLREVADNYNLILKRSAYNASTGTSVGVPIMAALNVGSALGNGGAESNTKGVANAHAKMASTGHTEGINKSTNNNYTTSYQHAEGQSGGENVPVVGVNFSASKNDSKGNSLAKGFSDGSSESNVNTTGISDSSSVTNTHGQTDSWSKLQNLAAGINTGIFATDTSSMSVNIADGLLQKNAQMLLTYIDRLASAATNRLNYAFTYTISDDEETKRLVENVMESSFKSTPVMDKANINRTGFEKVRHLDLSPNESLIIRKCILGQVVPEVTNNNKFSVEDNYFATLILPDENSVCFTPPISVPGFTPFKEVPPKDIYVMQKPSKDKYPLAYLIDPNMAKKTMVPVGLKYLFNTLICGGIGTGKTNLCKRLVKYIRQIFNIPVIVMNNKSDPDYNILRQIYSYNDTQIYELGDIGPGAFLFNLFYIPEGCRPKRWIEEVTNSLCKLLGQGSRSKYVIQTQITQMYIDAQVIDENGDVLNLDNAKYIDVSQLALVFTNMLNNAQTNQGKKTGFNTIENLNSISDKLNSLFSKTSILSKLLYPNENNFHKLEELVLGKKKLIILNTSMLTNDERQFISDVMAKYLFLWVSSCHDKYGISQDNPFMLLIEEAYLLFRGMTTSQAGDESINRDIWTDIAVSSRSYGMFYTMVTQNPVKMPTDIIDSCQVYFVFGINGTDNKNKLVDSMNYDPLRLDIPLKNWIGRQPVGMCTLKYNRNFDTSWINPILIYTPLVE